MIVNWSYNMRSEMVRLALRSLLLAVIAVAGFVGLAALGNARVDAPTAFATSRLRAEPQRALAGPLELRVVTFNIADGYGFTNNRSERMRAVAKTLRGLDPDLVGLQESFVEKDRALLLAGLAGSRLAHHVRFPGATVGNGLLILSAFPIEEAWFHRYASNNPWWRLGEGDWWAGKGIGLARVRLPDGSLLDFFDTHAQAGRDNPANELVRLAQMEELARFVREARIPGVPALVVGDFNTRPAAPDYALAVRETPLIRMMTVDSEIDHVFAVPDAALVYEALGTEEISGTLATPRPEMFLDRAPTLGEIGTMLFGPPGTSRLSDHPGYLARVRITAGTEE
jgi:endonuclease/exonuclease/phosphatase family metal-dependent hydrolase